MIERKKLIIKGRPSGPLYRTKKGVFYLGESEFILSSKWFKPYYNKINLIFTSPPFPLKKKKSYGNLNGEDYINWLANFSSPFNNLLKDDGSLVIELGSSWVSGIPTMSTESIQALLTLKERGNYHLCQEFVWHNPSSLPNPVQWVNVERIRVTNSFSRVWWLSKTPKPKADNRKILKEYSSSMKRLLKTQKYNPGKRPSGHQIGKKSFLINNGGAIPTNVLNISNTVSRGPYHSFCKNNNILSHPARMPVDLAKFFIQFLTDENDIILDPFAGSNVTGLAAEELGRKWRAIEKNPEYALTSKARFSTAWFLK